MNPRSTCVAWTALLCLGLGSQADDLYGVRYPFLTDLFAINQATGVVGTVGATGLSELGDLTSDTRPGSPRLWAVRIASNELVQLDPASGAALSVVPLNSPNNMVSIAFDPVSGRLFGNTSVSFGAPFDALYEIDPVTGVTALVGGISFSDVFALGFDQAGQLFGVSDGANQFIAIDTTTGAGSLVASLAVGFSFDIASRPSDNVMFLADSQTYSLYTVDTGSGALSLVGGYGQNVNVAGLAFLNPVPEASTVVAGLGLAGIALGVWYRHRRTATPSVG